MFSYDAATTISASPAAVWAVLVDVGSWPSWDSGVTSVDGAPQLGAKLTIRSEAAPGRAFPVKVTAFQPPSRMAFGGGMPLGMFRGERTYTLSSTDGATTRFTMREQYTGWMLGAISRSMPDLGPSFQRFADGLKARVEKGA